MKTVILGLGTNLGDRIKNLNDALEYISRRFFVVSVSKVYSTASLLRDEQQDYFNIAITIRVDSSPFELLEFCKQIEQDMGRDISVKKWGARVIDIDIIDYNNEIVDDKQLQIPHKHMHERSFVLYPLRDINAGYIHPVLNDSVSGLIDNLEDDLNITEVDVPLISFSS